MKRGLATTILLVCVVVLPGQARADGPAFTVANLPVAENVEGGNVVFIVRLAEPAPEGGVTLNYATADGTAAAGADYTAASGQATIDAGKRRAEIPVPILDDPLDEENEKFTLTVTHDSGAPAVTATATITDNDDPPSLSIGGASVIEGDAATVDAQFVVQLSRTSESDITVQFSTGTGTATPGVDYQPAQNLTLSIPAGESSGTISIGVVGDTAPESDETFSINIFNATNATIVGSNATGTIIDDDAELSISDASVDEPASGTVPMSFTVTLVPASARTVTVGYATIGGTASAGSDYTATSGTLTFAPGQTSQTVTVEVIGDTINEDNETVLVDLASAVNARIAEGQGQGTIIDKNAPPSLSISDTTAREGEGAKFTVELAGSTLRAVTVTFSTSDGTAREPGDYAARRGTLTFAPGEKTKTIEVSVVDDTVAEPFETFSVSLGDPVNATITKNRGAATIEASDQAAPASQNPPGPTVKPSAAPKVLLPKMVLAPRTVKVTVGGLARLFLTCAKASPITCSGSVTLQTTGKPAVKIGSKTFSVKKGKKQTLGVKLSPKARKLLTLRPTLRARVVVLVKTGKKSLRVVPGVITLKAAAKPKTTARPAP